jgi:hypothetical protein
MTAVLEVVIAANGTHGVGALPRRHMGGRVAQAGGPGLPGYASRACLR